MSPQEQAVQADAIEICEELSLMSLPTQGADPEFVPAAAFAVAEIEEECQ